MENAVVSADPQGPIAGLHDGRVAVFPSQIGEEKVCPPRSVEPIHPPLEGRNRPDRVVSRLEDAGSNADVQTILGGVQPPGCRRCRRGVAGVMADDFTALQAQPEHAFSIFIDRTNGEIATASRYWRARQVHLECLVLSRSLYQQCHRAADRSIQRVVEQGRANPVYQENAVSDLEACCRSWPAAGQEPDGPADTLGPHVEIGPLGHLYPDSHDPAFAGPGAEWRSLVGHDSEAQPGGQRDQRLCHVPGRVEYG